MIRGYNAGQRREDLTFKSPSGVSDGAGGTITTEVVDFITKGSVEPIRSLRSFEDLKINLRQTYEVVIRTNPNKKPRIDQLVYWNNEKYSIVRLSRDKMYTTMLITTNV